MEELVHEASEIQSEGKDLEEVLIKIKELEEVINKQRNYQKVRRFQNKLRLIIKLHFPLIHDSTLYNSEYSLTTDSSY